MTVFRSKTFKKNRPQRISRKLWTAKDARRTRKLGLRIKKQKMKQIGGNLPYRANPVGGVYTNPLDWDDNKEKTA